MVRELYRVVLHPSFLWTDVFLLIYDSRFREAYFFVLRDRSRIRPSMFCWERFTRTIASVGWGNGSKTM